MGAVYQQFICCIVCSFSGKFKRYSMHVHVFLWLPLVAPFIIVHPRQVPVKVLHLINFYIIKSDWWFDFAILVFFEDGISRRELLRNALYQPFAIEVLVQFLLEELLNPKFDLFGFKNITGGASSVLVEFQHHVDDVAQVLTEMDRQWLPTRPLLDAFQLRNGSCRPWHLQCREMEDGDPQLPYVIAKGVSLTIQQFRTGVEWCSTRDSFQTPRTIASKVEVSNLILYIGEINHFIFFQFVRFLKFWSIEYNVMRFDISMHHQPLMDVIKAEEALDQTTPYVVFIEKR